MYGGLSLFIVLKNKLDFTNSTRSQNIYKINVTSVIHILTFSRSDYLDDKLCHGKHDILTS